MGKNKVLKGAGTLDRYGSVVYPEGWSDMPSSYKQRRYLRERFGVRVGSKMTRGECKDLLTKLEIEEKVILVKRALVDMGLEPSEDNMRQFEQQRRLKNAI